MDMKLGLLTLREERRLRVFQNRMLRGMAGKKLLHNFCSSPNIFRMLRPSRM
jgi:hypothetical protein